MRRVYTVYTMGLGALVLWGCPQPCKPTPCKGDPTQDSVPAAGDDSGGGGEDPVDVDGDGYTDAAAGGDDCNDSDAEIHPGAREVCDGGVDNDCNGAADDADPLLDTASGEVTYRDADGDTFGDATVSAASCVPPEGYISDDQDCDDDDADTFPGAPEVCDDRDQDCDGQVDLGAAVYCTSAMVSLAGASSSHEALGVRVSGVGDLDGDGVGDVALSDPFWDASGTHADDGAAYVFFGPVTEDRVLSAADVAVLGSTSGERLGIAFAGPGDMDGDGYDDLLLGADSNPSDVHSGRVYLFSGPFASGMSLSTAGQPSLSGEQIGDHAGGRLIVAGDISGDGRDDLMVGAYDHASGSGAVYLLYSRLTSAADLGNIGVTVSGVQISGTAEPRTTLGSTVAAGDLNGDGLSDPVVNGDAYGGGAGGIFAFHTPLSGTMLGLSDADLALTGVSAGDQAGSAISMGDADGDGDTDMLIGARYANPGGRTYAGAAYLLRGEVTGTTSLSSISTLAVLEGETPFDSAGHALSLQDVDGDGTADVVVGAWRQDAGGKKDTGAAYLFYGPLSGTHRVSAADVVFPGTVAGGYAGYDMRSAPDQDGDGQAEILLGAYGERRGLLLLSGTL